MRGMSVAVGVLAVVVLIGCSSSHVSGTAPTTLGAPASTDVTASTVASTTVAPTTVVTTAADAAGAGPGAGAAGAGAGSAGATVVTTYEPWQAGQPSGVTVDSTASGSCFASSIASDRADAWRCMANNGILDPCFANPTDPAGSVVLCPDQPSVTKVIELNLTSPLTPSQSNTPQQGNQDPWQVLLADGSTCGIVTGATSEVDNLPQRYYCSDTSMLLGDPDESQPVWTIKSEAPDSGPITTVTVTQAWQ